MPPSKTGGIFLCNHLLQSIVTCCKNVTYGITQLDKRNLLC